MKLRAAIQDQIDDTVEAIARKEAVIQMRPTRSHQFALESLRERLAQLRSELDRLEPERGASSVPLPVPAVEGEPHVTS